MLLLSLENKNTPIFLWYLWYFYIVEQYFREISTFRNTTRVLNEKFQKQISSLAMIFVLSLPIAFLQWTSKKQCNHMCVKTITYTYWLLLWEVKH